MNLGRLWGRVWLPGLGIVGVALLFTSRQDLGIAMLVGLGVGTAFALCVRASRRLFRRWSVSQSPEYASYAYTIAAMVVLLVYAGLDGASWPLLAALSFLAVIPYETWRRDRRV